MSKKRQPVKKKTASYTSLYLADSLKSDPWSAAGAKKPETLTPVIQNERGSKLYKPIQLERKKS